MTNIIAFPSEVPGSHPSSTTWSYASQKGIDFVTNVKHAVEFVMTPLVTLDERMRLAYKNEMEIVTSPTAAKAFLAKLNTIAKAHKLLAHTDANGHWFSAPCIRQKSDDGSVGIIAVVVHCQITINGDQATLVCKADYDFNFDEELYESIPFRWTVDAELDVHGNRNFGVAPMN